jgi:multicomponent Na+:H+ antiporter subunit G
MTPLSPDITAASLFTIVFAGAGAILFIAGTLGLLRFPDTASRLHALSKADNLGLGLIVIGLLPQAGSIAGGAKMICVWLLAQLSAAAVSQLLGAAAARRKAEE